MLFYLGTHKPDFMDKTDVPLFISYRTIRNKRRLGNCQYAIDSGGFSELSMYGKWTVDPIDYVDRILALGEASRMPDFAAVQDYMCEPQILAKTGLSVHEHQRRTIDSYKRLLLLEPGIVWLPVIQGYTIDDYVAHVMMYRSEGIDLAGGMPVGVGSVCRRQGTHEVANIIIRLHSMGIKLHGFGIKQSGLANISEYLHSADSMAWSFKARSKSIRLPGHTHINCANCIEYALQWRENLLHEAV